MAPICALLVDDNGDFLDAAERLLSVTGDVAVIGRATSAIDAFEQVNRLNPDLVLMDWSMPGMSGLEATRYLKSWTTPPLVVLVTVHDAPRYRVAAQEAGADGFVPKSEVHTQLVALLRRLCE